MAKLTANNNVELRFFDSDGKMKYVLIESFLSKIKRRLFGTSPTGDTKHSVRLENLITNAGFAGAAYRLSDNTPDPFNYIAIGTGTTAAVVADTALETEAYRGLATVTRITTDVANDTAKLVATLTLTAAGTITEAGVFNDASAGTMLARQVFSGLVLESGDQVQVIWTFDFD